MSATFFLACPIPKDNFPKHVFVVAKQAYGIDRKVLQSLEVKIRLLSFENRTWIFMNFIIPEI